MTKTPNIALLIAAGLIAFLPGRPGLAADLDELGRVPYQFSKPNQHCSQNEQNGMGSCSVITPPVPAGKRLVIQHVSAVGPVFNGTFILVNIRTNIPGVSTTLVSSFFGPPPVSSGTLAFGGAFAFDQPVQIYADAGNTVFVGIQTDGNVANKAADFIITGSLVDCTMSPCAVIQPFNFIPPNPHVNP
jgi:hypothetical protein